MKRCGKAYEDAELDDLCDVLDSEGLFYVRRLLRDEIEATYLRERLTVGSAPVAAE